MVPGVVVSMAVCQEMCMPALCPRMAPPGSEHLCSWNSPGGGALSVISVILSLRAVTHREKDISGLTSYQLANLMFKQTQVYVVSSP